MRTHPLDAMCLKKSVKETFEVASSYSVVTHVDPRCTILCAIGTALIHGIILGEVCQESHIDEMVDQAIAWWSRYRERQMQDSSRADESILDLEELRRHTRVDDMDDLKLGDTYKIGYIYKTFGSGIHTLWLALRKSSESRGSTRGQMAVFEELTTDLIMRGGDADTNACLPGHCWDRT
jgi:ADP-ribosylglycohydrolase